MRWWEHNTDADVDLIRGHYRVVCNNGQTCIFVGRVVTSISPVINYTFHLLLWKEIGKVPSFLSGTKIMDCPAQSRYM